MAEVPLLRAVLDTNVYVSGTIIKRGTPFEGLQAWRRGAYQLVISEAIIAEIIRALNYPKLRDRFAITSDELQALALSLRTDALVSPGHYEVTAVSADPTDDKFLACALEAQADCVVTGDKHLLSLGQYQRIAILRPAEFLARLEQPAG